jgi:hypothetical protein
MKNSDISSRNSKTDRFKKRRTEFRAKANLGKGQCMKVMPLLT